MENTESGRATVRPVVSQPATFFSEFRRLGKELRRNQEGSRKRPERHSPVLEGF
jgi:hypothetical protein